MSWYASLQSVKSKGSQATRPGSLANLHSARKIHQGQFYTPTDVALFVWKLLQKTFDDYRGDHQGRQKISLLDNSVGSGRLLQFATPEQFTLTGIDVDQDNITALIDTAKNGGFEGVNFLHASMEEVRPKHFDVGLINPPFSLHIESPLLFHYPCCSWGKYGPGTSALSHFYALYQILDACRIVAAIMPSSFPYDKMDESIKNRLRAVIHLPNKSFQEEGTLVSTIVLLFDMRKKEAGFAEFSPNTLSEIPHVELRFKKGNYDCSSPSLNHKSIRSNVPSITLPVTHSKNVYVSHNQRRIVLKFDCGLMQAKIMNHVLRDTVPVCGLGEKYHRYAPGVEFTGQGSLDLECYLIQDNPQESFENFIESLHVHGANVFVSETLKNYIKKRIKNKNREITPFRHVAYDPHSCFDGDALHAVAKTTFVINPKIFGSPVIKSGDEISFTKKEVDGEIVFVTTLKSGEFECDKIFFDEKFEVKNEKDAKKGWIEKHAGKSIKFDLIKKGLEAKIAKYGIASWLSWGYQIDDLIEMLISPLGSIGAIDMGLGKARLSVALCMLSGAKHSLIAVEPHLVDELLIELNSNIQINKDEWQVIDSVGKAKDLKKINIIAYNRLRFDIGGNGSNRTYASMLRKRISVLVADEGHILKNPNSQQSRSLWQISARKKFILSGTPMANYPRDILPLLAFVSGDGTAVQPYGIHRSYMHCRNLTSMAYVSRGIDQFRDDFVTLDWVTNEFSDTLQNGAKREIPKIKDVSKFRKTIQHLVKRRVDQEPDVIKCFQIPVPTEKVTVIPWDLDHLDYYLKIANEFRYWYVNCRNGSGDKALNLVALLARIQAVIFACNCPQKNYQNFATFNKLTSKQIFAVERLKELTEKGHKTILYSSSPLNLRILKNQLDKIDIDALVFDGTTNIHNRNIELNNRFRNGDTPVLLASLGVTQTGLNLHQADRVIFYNRDWTSKVEKQAMKRVLRPQQKKQVVGEYLHLQGSIDDYMAQMVNHKRDAIDSGLDYGESAKQIDFLHIDTILGRFVSDLKKFRPEVYNGLKHAA